MKNEKKKFITIKVGVIFKLHIHWWPKTTRMASKYI